MEYDFFVFGGEKSTDHGLYIREFPTFTVAKRRVSFQEIPGRNGDAILDEGVFSNTKVIYTVWAKHKRDLKELQATAMWLLGETEYRKLEDTFECEIYRKAVCSNALEVETELNRIGQADITFTCKPQRFLRRGDAPITLTNGKSVYNAHMPSKPEITVQGTGTVLLNVGGTEIGISEIPEGGLVLDCDLQDAHSVRGENCNTLITIVGDYPELGHGGTEISWEGEGVTGITIKPRWWTL